MFPTFHGTSLFLKKKGWYGLEGDMEMQWGRVFIRLGQVVKEVKGEPVHLQGPGKWKCELYHSKD